MKSPPSPAAGSAGQITLYPMSDYVRGVRKPGQYHLVDFGVGRAGKHDRLVSEPHRHDFFEIIWIRQGSGTVHSDLRSYPVRPGTLFFSAPGQIHFWRLAGQTHGCLAGFQEEFFSVAGGDPGFIARLPFLFPGAMEPVLHLNQRELRRMDRLFRLIASEGAELGPGRDDLVRAYFTILLTHARQAFARRAAPAPAADLLANRFRLALEERCPELRDVRDYARLLGVSRTHLNEHLQRAFGRTAGGMIDERIALEAKRLLRHTSMTAAQVAFRLRFQDPSHFGRFFRRLAGRTPGEYRAEAQAEALSG